MAMNAAVNIASGMPINFRNHLKAILNYFRAIRLEASADAWGYGSDLPLPISLRLLSSEVINSANQLSESLPAFILKLMSVAVGPEACTAFSAAQSSAAGAGTQVKVDVAALSSEIERAQIAGIKFTRAQQHAFESVCPSVKQLF
jgi:hypothetical protein